MSGDDGVPAVPQEWVEAGAEALASRGYVYVDDETPGFLRDVATAVLAAVVPLVDKTPAVDIDALADYLHDEGYCQPWLDYSRCDCRDRALSFAVNAPLQDAAAVREAVRREVAEEIAEAIEADDLDNWPGSRASEASGCRDLAARIARAAADPKDTEHHCGWDYDPRCDGCRVAMRDAGEKP